MSRLQWSIIGERFFETGVDRGVLYVTGSDGVAWNGLVNVSETPSGGSTKSYFIDGVNYLNLIGRESFQATLTAFYSPPEFDLCDGVVDVARGFFATQQPRKQFGLCYRTKIGNDLAGVDHGYKLHLIYNALAAPTQKSYGTVNEQAEPSELAWTIVAKPRRLSQAAPTAHFIIDSTTSNPIALAQLEDILYGTDAVSARLPTPEEIFELIDSVDAVFVVLDNGDGTFQIDGDSSSVVILTADTYQLDSLSIVDLGDGTYNASSL